MNGQDRFTSPHKQTLRLVILALIFMWSGWLVVIAPCQDGAIGVSPASLNLLNLLKATESREAASRDLGPYQ